MRGIQHLLETVADGFDLAAQPAVFVLDFFRSSEMEVLCP